MRECLQDFLAREERSGAWFARQMNARGCESFTNVTLHKVLKRGRTIYLNEGVLIAEIIGLDLEDLR